MASDERRGEIVTALGVGGAAAFSPVVIQLFDVGVDVRLFGIPLLILYVFVIWGVLIVLLAIAAQGMNQAVSPEATPPPPPPLPPPSHGLDI